MRLPALPFALAFLTLAAGTALAAEPLTIAQIEKVTGMTGLTVKPAKYDKVAKNYVNAKNEMAVSVKVASASVYDVWKSQPSFSDQQAVPGLGEDAISSRKGRYVCFKKHNSGVCVTGEYASPGSTPLVSDAALLELAKLAASNL